METENKKTTIKQVCVGALAEKYKCSRVYVSQVQSRGGGKTILAKKIKQDADDIKAVLKRETTITI